MKGRLGSFLCLYRMTEYNDVQRVSETEVDPLLECMPSGDAEGNTQKIFHLSLLHFYP